MLLVYGVIRACNANVNDLYYNQSCVTQCISINKIKNGLISFLVLSIQHVDIKIIMVLSVS